MECDCQLRGLSSPPRELWSGRRSCPSVVDEASGKGPKPEPDLLNEIRTIPKLMKSTPKDFILGQEQYLMTCREEISLGEWRRLKSSRKAKSRCEKGSHRHFILSGL